MSIFGGQSVAGAESNLSGIESILTSLVPQFEDLSSQAAALAPIIFGQGQNDIYPSAIDQYVAGAHGEITPAQQAAVDETKQQMDLSTTGTYANLGLGDSTMKTQDLNANKQRSLAQTEGFAFQDESAGLDALKTALGFEQGGVGALGTAGQILSGATGALSGAGNVAGSIGNLASNQQQQQLSALSSLGSSIGGKGGAGSSTSLF